MENLSFRTKRTERSRDKSSNILRGRVSASETCGRTQMFIFPTVRAVVICLPLKEINPSGTPVDGTLSDLTSLAERLHKISHVHVITTSVLYWIRFVVFCYRAELSRIASFQVHLQTQGISVEYNGSKL